jgi:hypothetical protein
MVFYEYDSTDSTAITRIAYNRGMKQLAVIFVDNPKTYVYQDVPIYIEKYLTGYSKGKLVNEVKKFTEVKEYNHFPRSTRKFIPKSTEESNIPAVKEEPAPAANAQKEPKKKETPKEKKNENKKASRKRKEYRDYSKEWLEILDIPAVQKDRDYLTSLLPLFKGPRNSHYPMSIPPPPFDLPYDGTSPSNKRPSNAAPTPSAPPSTSNRPSSRSRAAQLYAKREGQTSAAHSRFESTNAYADLNDEDDDDEDGTNSDDELIQLTNQLHLNDGTTEPKITIQSRYLRVRIIILIADFLREKAVGAQKQSAATGAEKVRKYEDIRTYWSEAYELLFATSIEIGEWFALYYSYDGHDTMVMPMKDQHDKEQLHLLIDNFKNVQEDTEKKKDIAVSYLERRLDVLQKKLNPMLRERDEVKSQVGERRWKENPDPKFDYAEKRKEWEEELAEVTKTIQTLEELKFVQ